MRLYVRATMASGRATNASSLYICELFGSRFYIVLHNEKSLASLLTSVLYPVLILKYQVRSWNTSHCSVGCYYVL